MSRPECATSCFYCSSPLSARHEHDHFPVPARAGGADVVCACINCHDLKDRLAVDHWPAETLIDIARDLEHPEHLSATSRIFVAKAISILADLPARLEVLAEEPAASGAAVAQDVAVENEARLRRAIRILLGRAA